MLIVVVVVVVVRLGDADTGADGGVFSVMVSVVPEAKHKPTAAACAAAWS